MKQICLDGSWKMKIDEGEFMSGTIPGSVYSILLENHKMEDPYYRMNELDALDLMKHDFTFEREFIFSLQEDYNRILLHFDGLDTLCTIYLNNKKVGNANNFFRTWEYDVTEYLIPDKNVLRVEIDSPIKYIKNEDKKWYVGGSVYAMKGFPHLRKPHCMFGWDWGPRLPDAGIWKSTYLVVKNSSRLTDVHIRQHHNDTISIQVDVEQTGSGNVLIHMVSPEGSAYELSNHEPFIIEEPLLWWPNGLGEQNLYEIKVEIEEDGNIVDCSAKKIGLRTMEVERKQDEWGESFAHKVNGIAFFAMGADYIPEDNIFSRITPERTRKLLEQCKLANFNAIRVWGGGYYPSDEFYEACDELGLVVWQDMMFACANYPLTDDFEDNITEEITQNVKRIRHHASLGLWCGNNEMEMFEVEGKYDSNNTTRAHYIRMYEHIIPHILKKIDPDTYYWPASPSSGGSFNEPNDENMGDVHYWEVWHGGVPFSEYRKFYFRYVSEFGFQSFPDMKTIESFTENSDRNIFSRVMEMHQRNDGANGKILQYLSKTYLYPTSFTTLVYASQLLQAEAIKYGVEHWRRNRGRCMGAIYWQLNDIWPVASWASIDYYNRWKALHYYAKRFFSPIMISCEEVCETTTRSSVIQEPTDNISTAQLAVQNETKNDFTGTIEWKLVDADSNVIESNEKTIEVEKFSAKWFEKLDFSHTDYLENHFTYVLKQQGEVVSEGSVLFTAPKHYHFRDPELSYVIEENKIKISSKAYAKSVYISSPDADIVLEDNYFDMEKGEKIISIVEGTPKKLKLMSVYDIR